MNARARLGDVVAVDWLDAWCDNETTTEKDWKGSFPVTTYGILCRNGDVVTVVGERFPGDEGRSTTHIPRVIVQRITVLQRGVRP